MKYVCDPCGRLVDARAFRVDAGALVLTCPTCGQESRTGATPTMPAPGPAPRQQLASTGAGSNVVELRASHKEATDRARAISNESPFAVPEGHCPKCLSPRTAEMKACKSCGAEFALLSPDLMMPSPWLQQSWIALLQRWGELDAHDALVVEALSKGEMPALGRLYRLFLARVPADPLALRGREEVVRRASVPGLTIPATSAPANPPWRVALIGVLAVMLLAGFILLVRALLESST